MKRILCFLLCALLVLPMYSCSEAEPAHTEDTTDTTAPAVTSAEPDTTPAETEPPYPALPQKTYDGAVYTFFVGGCVQWSNKNDIHTEEYDGTPLNDAMHERNLYVESTYDVDLNDIEVFGTSDNGMGETFTWLNQAYQSGDSTVNTAILGPYEAMSLALKGLSCDLSKVPQLYLEGSWWDPGIIRDCTLAGQLYMLDGALTTISNDATVCVMFNKDMAADHNLGDLYQLVTEDQWTIDKMGELAESVRSDVNSDGAYTPEDIHGAIIWDDIAMALVSSIDERAAVVQSDGQLQLTLWTERLVNALDKFTAWAYQDGIGFWWQRTYSNDSDSTAMMGEGHALFYMQQINILRQLRDYDMEVGLLPMPKLDAQQENYGHIVSPYGTVVFTVPSLQADVEFTGHILEAMARKSGELVQPAYYEKLLIGRGLRDPESEATLDIILDSRVYDMGFFYAQMGMGGVMMNPCRSKANTFASYYRKTEPSALKKLETFNSTFAEVLRQNQ